MGQLVSKTVTMNEADWRKASGEATVLAVAALHDEYEFGGGRATRLLKAAELLSAASTLAGHANLREMTGDVDTAAVDVWDLSDEMEGEDDELIWPALSAKLRDAAGGNKKLLAMVEQIDRLHKFNVEMGSPVVTRRQFEEALAEAPGGPQ